MLLQGGCASTGVSITYDNEIHLITCVRYKYNQNHNDLDNDNVTGVKDLTEGRNSETRKSGDKKPWTA